MQHTEKRFEQWCTGRTGFFAQVTAHDTNNSGNTTASTGASD